MRDAGRAVGNAKWAKTAGPERQIEIEITKSMAKAIFVRALNDLNYDVALKYLEDRPLETPEEGRGLQVEAQDWFLNPDQGTCSLNAICQLLNYDPDHFTFAVRRHFAIPLESRKKFCLPTPDDLTTKTSDVSRPRSRAARRHLRSPKSIVSHALM
jgi:hypothetical protein